jgi:hypothetical protein
MGAAFKLVCALAGNVTATPDNSKAMLPMAAWIKIVRHMVGGWSPINWLKWPSKACPYFMRQYEGDSLCYIANNPIQPDNHADLSHCHPLLKT